jgi:hypothetical protein
VPCIPQLDMKTRNLDVSRIIKHGRSAKCDHCLSACLLILIMVLGNPGPAHGGDVFKPVWRWADPFLKSKYGVEWPRDIPEGEFKICTCGNVDRSKAGAVKVCSDNQAEGRGRIFACGTDNHRG